MLREAAPVERDDPVAADEAAGRPKLGRVLGQDEIASRTVPAEDRWQPGADRDVRVEQRTVPVDPLRHGVPGVLHGAGQPVRDGRQRIAGAGQGGQGAVARGRHQLDQLGQRGGSRGVRRLGLLDLDEATPDRQPLVRRVEQVVGCPDHRIRAAHVGAGRREGSGEPDERVVGQEVGELAQAAPRGSQVAAEAVERGPVDLQAGGLGARHHRHEIGPERARFVQRRQVAGDGQDRGHDDQCQQGDPAPGEEVASMTGRAWSTATAAGCLVRRRRLADGALDHGVG